MTDKAPPTTAMFYVANILTPLKSFVKESHAQSDALRAWLIDVGGAVCEDYLARISELQKTVQQTEGFLKKMKKKKVSKAAAAAAAAMKTAFSDLDKIEMQLYLDVEAYLRDLASILVEKDDLKKIHHANELKASVQEGKRLFAIFQKENQ